MALQLRLTESTAEVSAAHALAWHHVSLAMDKAGREEPFTALDRASAQRDAAFAARLTVRAVNRLFEASGAHAIADSDPLQRFHRDIHTGSHHATLNWDVAAQQYGRLALGGS